MDEKKKDQSTAFFLVGEGSPSFFFYWRTNKRQSRSIRRPPASSTKSITKFFPCSSSTTLVALTRKLTAQCTVHSQTRSQESITFCRSLSRGMKKKKRRDDIQMSTQIGQGIQCFFLLIWNARKDPSLAAYDVDTEKSCKHSKRKRFLSNIRIYICVCISTDVAPEKGKDVQKTVISICG